MTAARSRPAVAALAALVAACGGGDDVAPPDGAPAADAGPTDFRPDRVGFVNLVERGGFMGVWAELHDRPGVPAPERLAADGDCAVWARPAPALCDPPCAAGFCAAPGACTPWPENRSAGVITVTGLTAPLRFVPGPYGYEPQPYPPEDLFAPGAAVTASAPGDTAAGFTVTATGVAPLAASVTSLALPGGVDAEVTWTSAGSGRIQLALVVGWHGAPFEAMLLCETADDGALTVPGGLVTRLPAPSSGLEQHSSSLTRFERAVTTTADGPVELLVGSQVFLSFSRP